MEINNLIDRDYLSVSILEDMQQISEWLKEKPYLAIVDEELKVVGIVILQDVHAHPFHQVIDHNLTKPKVSPEQTIGEVFKLMKAAQIDFLPVYEQQDFIGVISLVAMTEQLLVLIKPLLSRNKLC
jgi:predicted transcriptional regulator